jgi:hypothetical protein
MVNTHTPGMETEENNMVDLRSYYEVVGDVIIAMRVNHSDGTAFIKITLPEEMEYVAEDYL